MSAPILKTSNHIHPLSQNKSRPEIVPVRRTRFSSDTYFGTEGVQLYRWIPLRDINYISLNMQVIRLTYYIIIH
jgi:hypothetical protein